MSDFYAGAGIVSAAGRAAGWAVSFQQHAPPAQSLGQPAPGPASMCVICLTESAHTQLVCVTGSSRSAAQQYIPPSDPGGSLKTDKWCGTALHIPQQPSTLLGTRSLVYQAPLQGLGMLQPSRHPPSTETSVHLLPFCCAPCLCAAAGGTCGGQRPELRKYLHAELSRQRGHALQPRALPPR
jgi:hypothetical protein